MALERARRLYEVRAHTPRGFLAVASHHRVDDVAMLFERPPKTLGLEHLRAPETGHAIAQRQRLLGDIGIVRRAVDRFMKGEIEGGHRLRHHPPPQAPRNSRADGQAGRVRGVHAIAGEADAQGLHLGGHFEHVDEPLDREFSDDRAAARTNFDQFVHRQLPQSLAGGCARRPEALGDLLFVERGSRAQGARRDFICQRAPNTLREQRLFCVFVRHPPSPFFCRRLYNLLSERQDSVRATAKIRAPCIQGSGQNNEPPPMQPSSMYTKYDNFEKNVYSDCQ